MMIVNIYTYKVKPVVLSLVQFLGLWEIILNLNTILNQQKYHYYQIIEINNLCFGFLKLVIGKIGLADSTLIHQEDIYKLSQITMF